jgi:hypothetical protein
MRPGRAEPEENRLERPPGTDPGATKELGEPSLVVISLPLKKHRKGNCKACIPAGSDA